MSALGKLLAQVRAEQAATLEHGARRQNARQALLARWAADHAQGAPASRARGWWARGGLALGLAAAACAIALIAVGRRAPRAAENATAHATAASLAFRGDGFVSLGSTLVAGRAASLRFSDASVVAAAAGTTMQVARLDADGAALALHEGRLQLEVVHRAQTRWRVDCGPYTVRVVGTKFEVAWEPATQRLIVEVSEGEVNVEGADGGLQAVRAGQRWAAGEVALVSAPSVALAADAPLAPSPTAGSDITAAWARATEARLAGDPAAAAAYLALRTRWPNEARAAEAAFELGRLRAAAGDDREARAWFERYLTAQPAGELAMSARGRLLEILPRLGAVREAKRLARDYLRLHPDGPQRAVALALVASSAVSPPANQPATAPATDESHGVP